MSRPPLVKIHCPVERTAGERCGHILFEWPRAWGLPVVEAVNGPAAASGAHLLMRCRHCRGWLEIHYHARMLAG